MALTTLALAHSVLTVAFAFTLEELLLVFEALEEELLAELEDVVKNLAFW